MVKVGLEPASIQPQSQATRIPFIHISTHFEEIRIAQDPPWLQGLGCMSMLLMKYFVYGLCTEDTLMDS